MRDSHSQINQAVEKLRDNYGNVNKNIDDLSEMIVSLSIVILALHEFLNINVVHNS